jgi:hypothetical protein
VEDAVVDARRLAGDLDPRVRIDSKGRVHVLPHGWEVEEATTRAGMMISRVVDDEVTKRTTELQANLTVDGKHYTPYELGVAEAHALALFDAICVKQRNTIQKAWDIDPVMDSLDSADIAGYDKLMRKRDRIMLQYDRMDPENRRLNEEWMKFKNVRRDYEKELAGVSSTASLNVISRIRKMGAPEEGVTVDRAISDDYLVEELGKFMKYFPTDWVNSSNNFPTSVAVETDSGRSYYVHEGVFDPEQAASAAGKDPNDDEAQEWGEKRTVSLLVAFPTLVGMNASLIHEFTHRMEYVHIPEGARIAELEDMFLRRRTNAGPRAKGPRQGKRRYKLGRKDEMTRPDNFADPYIGKEYQGLRAREILTTGMEGVFCGKFGNLIGTDGYKADPDHRAFVFGILATI